MEEIRNASLNLLNKSLAVAEILLERKTIDDYGRNLRGAVRALWNGTWDVATFIFEVGQALERAFNQAWIEGARSEGIEPDERSATEQARLNELIFEQSGYISGLAEYVNQHLKADGEKLGTAQARIPMWINRYREVRTIAKTMSGEDKKMMWVLGPTEHCSTCLKLAGKVKRKSQWIAHVLPRDPRLACGGFRCMCDLIPTAEPMSRGRLPSIP